MLYVVGMVIAHKKWDIEEGINEECIKTGHVGGETARAVVVSDNK